MNQDDINKSVDFIYKEGAKYAHAKAEVTYLEEYRKSKKAMLMKTALENGAKSAAAAEIEAYADVQYIELLKGLREAVEKAETLRWGLAAAEDEGETCTALKNAAEAILNRIPSQRQ